MIYLLDTNAFSDLMKPNSAVRRGMRGVAEADEVVLSATVRGEVLFGLRKLAPGKRRTALEELAAELFPAFRCLAVDEKVSGFYADLKVKQRQTGFVLDENDLWIAATVLASGAVLVTQDRDFIRVVNLTTLDWTRS